MTPTSQPAETSASHKRPGKISWQRNLYRKSAATFRWLHIYVSMLGFAALMFFALTGITLNHPTWFGGSEQSIRDVPGELPEELRKPELDRLAVAEFLRAEHALKGRVAEFEDSDYECMVVFKGPGYSADIFIDRETNKYMLTETASSAIAVMNDLHKGRDSGAAWVWLIDVSAIVLVLMSLSGFGLLFYLKKRRLSGIIVALIGTILLVVVWAVWVP